MINAEPFDELNKYTVVIKNSNNKIMGTGVVVTDELVVTCFHLVKDAKFDNNINIFFPQTNTTISSEVIDRCSDSNLDIALLRLNNSLPKVTSIAPLSKIISFGHDFVSLGFRKLSDFPTGLFSIGKIYGQSPENSLIQLYSEELETGSAGSPVLDLQINKVIGILVSSAISDNHDVHLYFAIPIETIIKVCPLIGQINPSLKPIYDFLRKIGEEGVIRYEKLHDLYVPPLNYEEIKESLSENKIVFITGPPEIGKTYTAVHLLWEYFNQGYEPIWFKVGEIDQQIKRSEIRGEISSIEIQLKPRHIIYYEDPFGKTEYEVFNDEGILRNIASIIGTVENSKQDVYVIITSREEVFKEFEDKKIGQVDLKKFEKKLHLKTSYSYEKRKEMLLRWAKVMGCDWQKNEFITNRILEIIKDDNKLSTPLNITNFAFATRKITNYEELLDKINEESVSVSRSFAEEIKRMNPDKILFLLLPFISDGFKVNFVKCKYQELITNINIQQTAMRFDAILEWFIDDKVVIKDGFIKFSHPLYIEAMQYTISEDHLTNRIFTEVLLNLYHNRETSLIAAKAIVSNYDKLPDNVRDVILFDSDIILNLVNDKENSILLSKAIVSNYDKLPDNVRDILFKLADDKGISLTISNALASNFDKLPSRVANELLMKLVNYEENNLTIARTIVSNYDKLPDNVRDILFKLADDKGISLTISNALASNFDKLPSRVANELLMKLSTFKAAIPSISRTIVSNYDKLPDNVRDILFKLADDKENSILLSKAIVSNYDKLPDNVRDILFKLIKNKNISRYVLGTLIIENAKSPEELTKKLFNLH